MNNAKERQSEAMSHRVSFSISREETWEVYVCGRSAKPRRILWALKSCIPQLNSPQFAFKACTPQRVGCAAAVHTLVVIGISGGKEMLEYPHTHVHEASKIEE